MKRAWKRTQKKLTTALRAGSGWSFKTTNNVQMKNFFFVLGSAAITLMAASCSKSSSSSDETTGNWVARSTFDGIKRTEAVTFTLNNGTDTSIYIVGGFNNGLNISQYPLLNVLWKYVPAGNGDGSWTSLKSIPAPSSGGIMRTSAVAFGIGNSGYVGTGVDENGVYLNDFYRYDAASNSWSPIGNLPGDARKDAVAFSINGKGYVATGTSSFSQYKDCYQYDPSSGWSATEAVPGSKRSGAVAFVINNKAYVATGSSDGGTSSLTDDFAVFDPSASGTKWTALNKISNFTQDSFDDDYTDIVRSQAVAFVINGKAYLTTGLSSSGTLTSKTWMYDPSNDRWARRTPFETKLVSGRQGAIAFSFRNLGYVGLGNNGAGTSSPLETFASFDPTVTYNEND
jgi:N-acetylneuraminic acid mutarotase